MFVARNRDRVFGRLLGGAEGEGHAPHVAEVFHRAARLEAAGDFDDRVFAHAIREHIGLCVEQDRFADLVAPVVVMGEAAEGGFDAACDDGDAGVGFAGALAVGEGRAVGAEADSAAGRVGVIVSDFAVSRVMVDHRVHVAGADAEEQLRAAETAPIVDAFPVRLAHDADAVAGGFEDSPEDRHREAGVIDVGVAGDEHDVEFVPAAGAGFFQRHGERASGFELDGR